MTRLSIGTIGLGTLLAAWGVATGCSSNSNPPSMTGPSSSSGGTSGSDDASSGSSSGSSSGTSSSGTTSSGGGSSSGASSGTVGMDAASGDDSSSGATVPSCTIAVDGGVTDKITACTVGTSPSCTKGCGPDLPSGGAQTNLGTKTCSCAAGTYACAACVYESPLPACYTPAAAPAACPAGTADKLQCTMPCSGSTTGTLCTITTDAGKVDGCVCISAGAGNVWTCATQWW